jgi:hypothetical protein
MVTRMYPSLWALESNDEGRLVAEVGLVRIRTQAAVVRALADQIEVFVKPDRAHWLGDQLVEEAARLACGILEAAAELAKALPPEETEMFDRRLVGHGRC